MLIGKFLLRRCGRSEVCIFSTIVGEGLSYTHHEFGFERTEVCSECSKMSRQLLLSELTNEGLDAPCKGNEGLLLELFCCLRPSRQDQRF